MTDLEKFINLLKEFNISYFLVTKHEYHKDNVVIELRNHYLDKKYSAFGYPSNVSNWIFSPDGKYLAVGHYES